MDIHILKDIGIVRSTLVLLCTFHASCLEEEKHVTPLSAFIIQYWQDLHNMTNIYINILASNK